MRGEPQIGTLKVYYSSALQTISVRSVYIKIINYNDIILVNLNNTMQTKQHAIKKPHLYSNRNKFYKVLLIVVEGFEQEMFKSSIFVHQIS